MTRRKSARKQATPDVYFRDNLQSQKSDSINSPSSVDYYGQASDDIYPDQSEYARSSWDAQLEDQQDQELVGNNTAEELLKNEITTVREGFDALLHAATAAHTTMLDPAIAGHKGTRHPPSKQVLSTWSRLRFVRAGWFTAVEAVNYVN